MLKTLIFTLEVLIGKNVMIHSFLEGIYSPGIFLELYKKIFYEKIYLTVLHFKRNICIHEFIFFLKMCTYVLNSKHALILTP